MSIINLKKKELQIKVVYYGPGRGGKTTNLEYVNKTHRDRILTDMVSLKTYGDRTLFFDFLPMNMGTMMGYEAKVQLYTVPGQVKYNATRKLVLKGVDGLVFVADSQVEQRQKNVDSLNQLYENLKLQNVNLLKTPLVLQYNKVDLRDQGVSTLPFETLERDLNSRLKVPSFEASALRGDNVLATLIKIITITMASVKNQIPKI